MPACADTVVYDHDVHGLGPALRHGGDQPGFRLVSHADVAWAGAPSASWTPGTEDAFTPAVPSVP
ncbi:hypothetical protein GCM10017687_15360 [Streptomyces echinatus]